MITVRAEFARTRERTRRIDLDQARSDGERCILVVRPLLGKRPSQLGRRLEIGARETPDLEGAPSMRRFLLLGVLVERWPTREQWLGIEAGIDRD